VTSAKIAAAICRAISAKVLPLKKRKRLAMAAPEKF
jgi:hypothetical protein